MTCKMCFIEQARGDLQMTQFINCTIHISIAEACLNYLITHLNITAEWQLGMRELCWNYFRNNDGVKESRIIPEF